jgi:hypothetical protein
MAERIRISLATRNHNSGRDCSAQVPLTSLLSTTLQSTLLDRQPTVYALALTHACNFHTSQASSTISVSLKAPPPATGGAATTSTAAPVVTTDASTIVPSKRNGSGKVKNLPVAVPAAAAGRTLLVEGANQVPFVETLEFLKRSLFTCHTELSQTTTNDVGTPLGATDGSSAWSVPPQFLPSYRVGSLLHVLTLLTLRCAPVATSLAVHEPESKLLTLLMHAIPDTAAAAPPSILPLTMQSARLLIALALRSNGAARAVAAAAVEDIAAAATAQPRAPQQQRRVHFAAHVLRALTAHSRGVSRGPMAAVHEACKALVRIVHASGACVHLPLLLRPPPPRSSDDNGDTTAAVLAACVLATLRSLTVSPQLLQTDALPLPPGGAPAAVGPVAEAMAAALASIEDENAALLNVGARGGPADAPAAGVEASRGWLGGEGALWPEVDLEFEEHQNMVHEMMDAIDHEDAAGMHVDAAAVDVDLDGGDLHVDEAEDFMAAHVGGQEDDEDEEEDDVDTELEEEDDGDEHMHEWHDVDMHAVDLEPDGGTVPTTEPNMAAAPAPGTFRTATEETDVGASTGERHHRGEHDDREGAAAAAEASREARPPARGSNGGSGRDMQIGWEHLGFRADQREPGNGLNVRGRTDMSVGEEGSGGPPWGPPLDVAADPLVTAAELVGIGPPFGSVIDGPYSNGIYPHSFFGSDNEMLGNGPAALDSGVPFELLLCVSFTWRPLVKKSDMQL